MKKILSKILTLTLLAAVCFTSLSSIDNTSDNPNNVIGLFSFDDKDNPQDDESL